MTTWTPSDSEVEFYAAKTAELRLGNETHWQEARERLLEAGIAPDDAAVVQLTDEGYPMESAVAVSRDGRFFDFNIIRWIDRDLPQGSGHVSGWREVLPDETNVVAATYVGQWARARAIAKAIFERDGSG